MILENNKNYCDKENKMIVMIENEMKQNENWAENLYDDDDPHTEMLIKYVMEGVSLSFPHYLNILLTNAPEHKLEVLGGFLLSGVLIEYIKDNNDNYLNNLFIRFPDILERENFWKGFVYKINNTKNFQVLDYFEKKYDPNLKQCIKYANEDCKDMFEKYQLYKTIDKKLNKKLNQMSVIKI